MSIAAEIIKKHDDWRSRCINLIPSENILSPAAGKLLASDMATRYTLPINEKVHGSFVENAYRGTKYIDEIVELANNLGKELFKAKHVSFAPLSGHIAGLITLSALCRRGDLVMSLDSASGGYDGYVKGYMPDMLGLRWKPLNFNHEKWNLDVEATAEVIGKERPNLVILGASFFPFPHDVRAVSDACRDSGSLLAYDGSHVLGLIAGGVFQDPLKEGADVLIGNTHKSFFGPQGGCLMANDEEIFSKLENKLTWHTVDNLHWNRIAATAQALEEMSRFGKEYASRIVSNSKTLAAALCDAGLEPKFGALDFTESHQVILDPGAVEGKGLDFNLLAKLLEKQNIITDAVGRLGTSEVTRLGMVGDDMNAIADFMSRVISGEEIKEEIVNFRGKFEVRYC